MPDIFFRSDLDPNCLQRLSADDTAYKALSLKRLHFFSIITSRLLIVSPAIAILYWQLLIM